MLSPTSKRNEVSPSKRFVSSPRGNKHGRNHFSCWDAICAGFLRHFKWLTIGVAVIAATRMFAGNPGNILPNTLAPTNQRPTSSSSHPEGPQLRKNGKNEKNSFGNKHEEPWQDNRNEPNKRPKSKPKNPKKNVKNGANNPTSSSTAPIDHHHHSPQTNNIDVDESSMPTIDSDDILALYNAYDAPVIGDATRKVQVHLIVDVAGSEDINPASKMLLAGIERSNYLQLTALTFVRPAIFTIDGFPRETSLPLLYLVDWGSMDRDCHRLQIVLENIRSSSANQETASDETEEPYFLLMDSSGSTRTTGCSYLFRGAESNNNNVEGQTMFSYGHTNDMNRIRLAKRSIVANRYFDHESEKIHLGKPAPNGWDDVPLGYDRPVLHSPFPLRESFVLSVQNATEGQLVTKEKDDSLRPIDVGYFWKPGDYSHYGFYRRTIAKVVKTLHHSKIDKKAGKRMENLVQISYSDEKGMEAGNVQFKYTVELLTCKIVVITQRDEWEDHYRLMESLASGALVMTDRMVALPAGFEDKVNIVIYDNPTMLKKLIRYYIRPENRKERKRIASKGYELVMGRHRCWHRLEELLFGRPLTNVDQPYAPAPEKEA